MIDFETLEDALFDAVQQSTGFADSSILFDSGNGVSPQPTAYATIYLGDLTKIGHDASDWDFDAGRPAGAEIRRTTAGMRDFTVRFSFFTPATDGLSTARTMAAKLEADLSLASIRDSLNAVGLGILDTGGVRWVPKLNNTDFEGRAIVEVRFAVPQGSSDTTGYIAEVDLTPVIDGVTGPPIIIK